MANDIAGRPWRLDTAGTTVLWKGWIKAAHFEYSGYTVQGSLVVIKDQNGRVVWSASGASDLEEVRSGKVSWFQGLILDTCQNSGVVTVYIE